MSRRLEDWGDDATGMNSLFFQASRWSGIALCWYCQGQTTTVPPIEWLICKYSYKDLATKYDLSKTDCMKRYSYTTKRLLEVLQIVDGKIEKDENNQHIEQVQERSGSLPEGQRWYPDPE